MKNTAFRGQKGLRGIRYIWDYYRLWILAVCALLLFLAYMAVNIKKNSRDCFLYVLFVNTQAELGEGSDFHRDFLRYCDAEDRNETAAFDTGNFFSLTDNRITGNYYYQKAVVLLDSETADAIVTDPANLRILGGRGRLMDLRDTRTAALAEKYRDRLLTAVAESGDMAGEEIPVGIDLSDSRLASEYGAYPGGCALGVSALTQHPEAIGTFLAYLLDEA